MPAQSDTLGGRLPLVDPAAYSDEQRELFDYVIANQLPWAKDNGFKIRTEDGRLIGPFNAFLLRPKMALKFLDFSAAEHEYTSLTEREREVVVITLGGLWQAEYELYAHVTLGRVAGLSESNVKAIASGDLPAELSEREKIVGRVTRKLAVDHRIDDSLYKTAEQTFGRKGMFDIVAIMGQYLLTSTLLTMFMVPAPE